MAGEGSILSASLVDPALVETFVHIQTGYVLGFLNHTERLVYSRKRIEESSDVMVQRFVIDA